MLLKNTALYLKSDLYCGQARGFIEGSWGEQMHEYWFIKSEWYTHVNFYDILMSVELNCSVNYCTN